MINQNICDWILKKEGGFSYWEALDEFEELTPGVFYGHVRELVKNRMFAYQNQR